MMLRSSSTPVLGSLLSSLSSESPNISNSNHHHQTLKKLTPSPYHNHNHHHQPISCNSSPISPSIADFSDHSSKGFRRAQSDGNLQGLVTYASCNSISSSDEFLLQSNSSHNKKFRQKCLMLETIPSFSMSNPRGSRYESDEDDEDEESDVEDEEEENEDFVFSNKIKSRVLSEEVRVVERSWNVGFGEEGGITGEGMFLARGLGIDCGSNGNGRSSGGGGGSGGGGFNWAAGDGGDIHGTEEYYKKMLQENPGNPLFLRNYAQFLYQKKQDIDGAEEYYSRAILADPKDGEVLSQYAKLVWELHHDKDRALSYFERAVQASPEDGHVHASYAGFLWEIEEDEDECHIPSHVSPHFQEGDMASASV